MLSVEAFARGYLLAFVWRLLLVLLVVSFAILFFRYWQGVVSTTLFVVAVIVLVVNIRDARGRGH